MKKSALRIGFFIFFALALLLFPVSSSHGQEQETSPMDHEIRMGEEVSKELETHFERVENPVLLARLSMILQRLIPLAERPLPFEVRVVQEDRPNAFSLPGGIVYMTTGMVSFCRSDAEIAAVLAHEVIHADRGHVMLQVARNRKLTLVALGLAIATKGQAGVLLAGNLAQVAIMNSYSRDLEEEADRLGLEMLHGSGYPPSGMVTMLERLRQERMKRPWRDPGIYQDHPDVEDRVVYVIEQIRQRGWPLQRKVPLHLLRVLLDHDGDYLHMSVDETLLFSVPFSEENRKVLSSIRECLLENLQLEMMPSEIQVLPDNGRLRVGNRCLPLEKLTGSQPEDPGVVRDRIVAILLEAKSKHPVAEYMR